MLYKCLLLLFMLTRAATIIIIPTISHALQQHNTLCYRMLIIKCNIYRGAYDHGGGGGGAAGDNTLKHVLFLFV